MASSNAEIASLLYELARLTALDEGSPQSFRARAYEGAARTVEGLGQDAADMSETALTTLRGVGKSTARKIREYVETGAITKLEELRERFPPGYLELTRIPGLGPKTIELLRSELGVQNVEDLRTAIESEALRDLPGLGAKTEENLARAIELLGVGGKERRTPILEAMRVALDIVEALRALPRVEAAEYTGSLRRFRETIGDVDIVVVTAGPPEPVMERFVELPIVRQVIAHGDKKSSVLTPQGLQVDLRVVTPEQAGAALLYFTGSKAHNIRLRQVAIDRGWTLNEYGLTDVETGQVVASATEEEIYRALGLDYVPPPLREDTGEIEAAARGELPDLVTVDDIRGDLHVHTSLSGDGRDSLEKMVAAAAERGYEYLAVTEHAENLTITGISREQMLRHR
ncbi:MAG: helix-hairpin-helix domain-containing protein, partial [Acidimicrobiia bacterium]